jgi:hypothetical protein
VNPRAEELVVLNAEEEFDDNDDTLCEGDKESLLLVWDCGDELLTPGTDVDVELPVLSAEEVDDDANDDAL